MLVLLVDDEPTIRVTLGDALRAAGHEVLEAATLARAREVLLEQRVDLVITDIRLPDGSGRELVSYKKEHSPYSRIVLITGYGTVEEAVSALKEGADDYVTKPFLNEDVLHRVERIGRELALEEENRSLRARRFGLAAIVGRSPAIRAVLERVAAVAQGDYTVLITGESGTGKEVVARAIHQESPRRERPFVPLSCGAVPETLLEDELFGHEKGAFTDAVGTRRGAFERADTGTLFLDDIDDMPLALQVRLLRVLEERTFFRLGGTGPVEVDVRIIAASKEDLGRLVAEGRFREDLYYRLNVVPLSLPPLRERKEDIPLLVEEFLRRYGGGAEWRLEEGAMEMLLAHDWPGNVRELENAVRRAVALAGEERLLRKDLLLSGTGSAARKDGEPLRPLEEILRRAEREHILRALEAAGWNRTRAAALLGISRKTLWEKMRTYGLGGKGRKR